MTTTYEMNLIKLFKQFHDEDACRDYLEVLRWPDGVRCLRCSSPRVSGRSKRGQYECYECNYQFSVLVGTIFHDSHLPLSKWFLASYLMIEAKKGVSAAQLQRTLDVAYRTAWCLCHRIRAAMRDAYPFPLKGIVEVDETFLGGKVEGKGRGYKGNKAVIVGAVQRGGKIVLQVAPDRSRLTLHGFIQSTVADEAEAIFTDEWAPYQGIADDNTRHETVNHSIDEYVRGDVHTNGVEGVWSLFKRSVIGSFHKISLKHLDAYLDELEWRFNNRDNPYLFRDTLLKLLKAENLEYKELVS